MTFLYYLSGFVTSNVPLSVLHKHVPKTVLKRQCRPVRRPPSRVSFTFSTSIGETDSEVTSHTGLTDKSVPMDMSEAGDQ